MGDEGTFDAAGDHPLLRLKGRPSCELAGLSRVPVLLVEP
jgi:hypothetical protein